MLAILRVLAVFCYFVIANVLLILICVARPFHRDNVFIAGQLYAVMGRLVGLKLIYRVPETVKKGGPFVFIGNHQNSYDLITVCGAAQRGMVTVGKKSLKWIPVFGWVYWLSGNILIDRKNSGRAHDTLQSTIDKINERRLSVWFFPEGTRSYGRGLLSFKTGAFRIAQATSEPVVTVCASDLHEKVKLNRWDNGTMIIEIGEPVLMDDSKSIKAWSEYFHTDMKQNLVRINDEVAQIEKAG